MSEVWELGACEITRLIGSRQLSCREVVQAHQDRIAEINPFLNAVTAVLEEQALASADATDDKLRQGEPIGALAGLPFTVKEGLDVEGSATTHGLAPLKAAIAPKDAAVVRALRSAGAIPLARTNMPEFGMRWHTTNALHGATKNPWNAEITPGASSGGEAVAIAAGMSPLGVGSDGAGSLRWPAQCCGIAALKPSHGRLPTDPAGPFPFAFQLLAVVGPMARRVEDLRLAFSVMCQEPALGDPWHVPASPVGPPLAKPIRVAVIRDPGGLGVDPAVASAIYDAAGMLWDAGYAVEEREAPSLQRVEEIYLQIMNSFGRLTAEPERAPVGLVSAEFDAFWGKFRTAWDGAAGMPTHDPMMERRTLYRAWAEMMADCPLVLSPIATVPAFRVGADLEPEWGSSWIKALRMITVASLLGLPSAAVPVGLSDGVPQGVQIMGPRFREDLCLEAAEAIEARSGFRPLAPCREV